MHFTALNYLLFVTKPYSLAILEPFQKALERRGAGDVCWFMASTTKDYLPPGKQLRSTEEVLEFNPDAVIVPGNVVPDFWPGLKVQIFHGLDEETKGFYRITGFFDLYCTPGPVITQRFSSLSKRYKTFLVSQTGWPKLDQLAIKVDYRALKRNLGLNLGKPVILYAPTFPPKYTSATALLPAIRTLNNGSYQWLIKFHSLMDRDIQNSYRELIEDNFQVVDSQNILPYMQAADVLVTDTSSVAYEFLLLDRPIITYNAIARIDKGINITSPAELGSAIEKSLADPQEYSSNRQYYLNEIHPYQDGESSIRIIDRIGKVLETEEYKNLKRKPGNWVRKWQIRKIIQ